MSNISKTFSRLKKQGKKAFIPYIMAGDPSLSRTKALIKILEECGADIIELGVPFTDPVADGPVIQRAAERAIEAGVTLRKVLGLVAEIRDGGSETPIVLMTYYNPIYKYGLAEFLPAAKEAGVDGLIIPDLPPDEAEDLIRLSRPLGIDTIFMLAPTSTPERAKMVVKSSRGFIYYVSITGITGARLDMEGALKESIGSVRASTKTPVCVGFGVSTPEEAASVAAVADGVIVGSAIVKRISGPEEDLREYLRALREAI